jgi:CBS domain-containing protein
MQAKDLMTRIVVSIDPRAHIADALSLMLKHQVSGLPVLDENRKLVGIVTERDLLRRADPDSDPPPWWKLVLFGTDASAREYTRTHVLDVASVMTADVHCVEADAPLETVVALMERHRIRRIPVVQNGKLIGIVSRRDLLRPLFWALKNPAPEALTDAEIAAQLDKDLATRSWNEARAFTTTVRDGVVELEGVVFSEEQRHELRALAQNVKGVKDVNDRMIMVGLITGTTLTQASSQPRAPGT